MSEQTAMETAVQTTYTVQVVKTVEVVTGRKAIDPNSQIGQSGPRAKEYTTEKQSFWADIATVTVPRKSPRRKVIGLALAQSGIRPAADSEPLRVRVLDAASASETSVAAVQPEPEWKVG